jgi:hypothetical protein
MDYSASLNGIGQTPHPRITERGIAGDLFYAVQSLNQNDGRSQCTITTGTDDSPSLTKKWVSINCGQKNIIVFKRTFGGHTYDSVEEQIGDLQRTNSK